MSEPTNTMPPFSRPFLSRCGPEDSAGPPAGRQQGTHGSAASGKQPQGRECTCDGPSPPLIPLPCPQVLESRLQRPLPEDLAEALASGVVLCQLANQLRPRSVPFIHVPSPAVVSGAGIGHGGVSEGRSQHSPTHPCFPSIPQPKLSALKSRKNVESFLEACRKMGVPEVWRVSGAGL